MTSCCHTISKRFGSRDTVNLIDSVFTALPTIRLIIAGCASRRSFNASSQHCRYASSFRREAHPGSAVRHHLRIFSSLNHNSTNTRENKISLREYSTHELTSSHDSTEQHRAEVEKISASVRRFYERGEKFRISHGSTNSTRKGALGRDPNKTIDTSALSHVLSVDIESMTALVEPNVPMDRLVEATIKHGLIPPVVMEFPGITVGGGYSGTSGESSSFKHGFFNNTLKSVEMVLADGEVVLCSDQQHPDLFFGAAGALGTLGVTTLVEIQLRKAKKFVETTYHPVSSIEEAVATIQDFATATSAFDYVDGIMYSKDQGAIITGCTTDEPKHELPIQRFSAPDDPWFYMHVRERISQSSGPSSEVVPLPDYLFRYDRGGFWVGEAPFKYFKGMPFNKFTRKWLDDFLHTRMLYRALHASGQSERMIIQDLALPYDTAEKFIDYMADRLAIWPLWLCPLKQGPLPTMHPHLEEYQADEKTLKPMLNIGLWGDAPSTQQAFVQTNLDIERKLHELHGMKWLYAQTFYSEEEFWQDFDKSWYDGLREKYRATSLPTVYEKVRATQQGSTSAESQSFLQRLLSTWPMPGIKGLRKAIQSGDYMLARNAAWKDWVPRI